MAIEKRLESLMAEMKASGPQEPFSPCAWYNVTGDALELYLSADPAVTERVDTLFSILVSRADPERVVGVVIKNIKKHFGQKPLSDVFLATGRAKVSVLLFGAVYSLRRISGLEPSENQNLRRILDLLQREGDTEVTLENAEAVGAL